MANSQHRCVFVGNIPYDATEEQLVQICEEVGPVVSFRLVIDRETGKPKGYGFCEYKDEETALSARRNLHGYDINGRQLRVDFAENDKNNERTREQGRGGPGLTTNTAPQKQIGGPAVDPSLHQAVGIQDAMAAAVVMAGVLGGAQTNTTISQNGIRSQPIPGNDPLTLHLAKIPKSQLTEVLNEVKAMATQNKEQARQLFLAHPQLSKAVLQAQIMLKSVPPHLIQVANARQLPGQHPLPSLQGGQLGQQSSVQVQPLSGLPPLAQNKMPLGFMPQSQSQPASLVSGQYAALSLPPQPRFQTPLPVQHQVLAGNLQSLVAPVQPSIQSYPPLQDNVFKPSSSIGSGILNNGLKDNHRPNMASRLHENDQIAHPPKLLKMENGKGASFSPPDINLSASVLGSSQKPATTELPAGMESELLQQVLNLTPEQLSSLPLDQQQQVIQLQQMLKSQLN